MSEIILAVICLAQLAIIYGLVNRLLASVRSPRLVPMDALDGAGPVAAPVPIKKVPAGSLKVSG